MVDLKQQYLILAYGSFNTFVRIKILIVTPHRYPMIIREDILFLMFARFEEWSSSPEDFLCFIKLTAMLIEADSIESGGKSVPAITIESELGDIFIKAIGVDFPPYKTYTDMEKQCSLKEDIWERFRKISKGIKDDVDVSDLMEETGLAPNEITRTLQLADYEMTQFLIDALRPHIDFK
ncbi:hypothetical protein [Pedobacter steynii]|uniref:Uncharacterized protein n=1 Tax=Pedobacter steynii TaxID=430522 RepID=A0A1D7QMX1_9SPHI|nr:hypothetical protein [Pedobacter steynii]AOM80008.1 hypothetical protein BFS30_24315 [Pedobacter steynii]